MTAIMVKKQGQSDGDKNRTPKQRKEDRKQHICSSCSRFLCPLKSLIGMVCRVPAQLWLKTQMKLRYSSLETNLHPHGTVTRFLPHLGILMHIVGDFQHLGSFKYLENFFTQNSILLWLFSYIGPAVAFNIYP